MTDAPASIETADHGSGPAAEPIPTPDLEGVYGRPVVELIGVEKTYYKPDGSVMVHALRGVDLTIREGEYVAIMGASGSGKSTLMNTLGCLDKPTKGQYILDGRDARGMDDESLSKFRGEKIGFVFQAFNLIPQLTVEENVEVPLFYQGKAAKERKARSEESLGLVGLGDRLDHRPRELSGGQQQRRALRADRPPPGRRGRVGCDDRPRRRSSGATRLSAEPEAGQAAALTLPPDAVASAPMIRAVTSSGRCSDPIC